MVDCAFMCMNLPARMKRGTRGQKPLFIIIVLGVICLSLGIVVVNDMQ